MDCELKPQASGKILNLNVTSDELVDSPIVRLDHSSTAGQLSAEETQLLLQKLSINNPFYRFRKQSNSLRELRRMRKRARRQLRRHRSEADLMPHPQQHPHSEAKVVVVLDSKQYLTLSSSRQGTSSIKTRSVSSLTPDNSTVITNPFSIFHDDEILTLGVNPRLRSANSATAAIRSTRPQRSGKGLRRLFDRQTTPTPASQQYLQGVPVRRFERQDFNQDSNPTGKPKRAKAIFKQLSLRKLHKTEEPSVLPKLKLSYRYPNRTQSIQSMRTAGSGGYDIQHTAYRPRLVSTTPKSNYFERLQAKTRLGIQKIRDKCRNFKASSSDASSTGGGGSEFSGFHTLAKDESFRFISDRAHISSYESRCAAAHAAGKQATIYKSYKSEIDLSKNLHYLEHYLEQNFEQQLSSSKQSAHSVGRISGAQRRGLATPQGITETETETEAETKTGGGTPRRRHKRSQSQANSQTVGSIRCGSTANYENLGTLPISARAAEHNKAALHSDSLSSSDYASVFSGPTAAKRETAPQAENKNDNRMDEQDVRQQQESVLKLRYEHPDKMCEYYFDNLTSYALALEESEDLLLAESAKSARLFYDDEDDDDEEDVDVDVDDALATNEPDFMARDIRIRVKVNECEDADWYQHRQQQQRQRQQATSYNENLAESTFYQSLNQHLQRQAIAVDDRHKSETASASVASLGGESYLAHFERSRSRSDFERIERNSLLRPNEDLEQFYARGEYYGFGGSTGGGGVGSSEVVYATRQRRADLMEAHYSRSYPTAALTATTPLQLMPSSDALLDQADGSGLASYKRSCALRIAATTATAATTTSAATTLSSTNISELTSMRPTSDVLYATSSKQQQFQLHTTKPEPEIATDTTAAVMAPAAAAGLSAGNANTNTSANNRYMLENLRKYYANQQQHPPAHSVNSSSLSNSSSSNSSMSQQQKLHLPTAQPHSSKQQQQQLHLGPPRRNSSTSNASSTAENFDSFIALRNATTSTPTTADYMAKQQLQPQRRSHHQGAAGKAPLISALNYYGQGLPSGSGSNSNGGSVLTYNGKLSATAMLSQVNLARSSALHQQHTTTPATTATTTPTASASASATESFILEYEC
ncbi:uncharacterized protein Dvir_GJ23241 [Drosophila virilis]|uniref:Uncharacterized protein n=2 Tax=Drosophila virilis TaxID=7244 RepID=B4LZM0_DROVI|nr:uncharacterized protein Dvir_GJ23241 [Drosophila virilis]